MRMSASPAAHAPENVPPKRFRPVITPMLSTPTNASPAAPAQVFARRRLFRRSKPDISRIRKRGMAAAVPLFVSPAGTSSPLSARQTAIFRNFACKKGKHDEFRNHPRQSNRRRQAQETERWSWSVWSCGSRYRANHRWSGI